jgi:hypothetical protein
MWGRRKAAAVAERPTELQQRAGEAERLILAMPERDRVSVLAAVERMATAGADLKALPDQVVEVLGRLIFKFILELHLPAMRKPSPEQLVRQVVDGAPTLLGPHRAAIEKLLGASPADA